MLFKRFLSCFFAIIILLSCAFIISADASSNIKNIRKIVSVVYDDSGSMWQNGKKNWAYANYAMQAFTALMNENDKLFITYMSTVTSSPIELTNKKDSVDIIRKHDSNDNTSTPFGAIETAKNKLISIQDNDKDTQYWLVIITDGQFQDGQANLQLSKLNQTLADYTNFKMPNGTQMKITFLAIGDDNNIFTPNNGSNIIVKSSLDGIQIFKTISDIADQVSGRIRLNHNQISQVDSRTIAVSSAIPLMKIAVLTQTNNDPVEISSVKVDQGDKLHIEQTISIRYPPEVRKRITDTKLNGSVTLVSDKNGNIPAGKYILKFSKDVSISNIDIMFEPAIKMKIVITRLGKEISDTSILRANDIINIKCKFYIIGTDTEITGSQLPKFEKTGLVVNENALPKYGGSELELKDIKLKQLTTEISAFAQISEYIRLTDYVKFTPNKPVVYGLTADPANKDLILLRCKFKHGTQGPRFIITADGQPVSQIEAENLLFTYSTDKDVKFKLAYQSDGSILLLPKSRWPLICIPTGEIKLKGVLNNTIVSNTSFKIGTSDWLCVIWDLLWPIILFLYIVGLIIKKRFPKATIYSFQLTREDGKNVIRPSEEVDINGWKQCLIPYISSRVSVGDCVFVGGRSGFSREINISKKTLNGNNWMLKTSDLKYDEVVFRNNRKAEKKSYRLGKSKLYLQGRDNNAIIMKFFAKNI